MEYLTHKNHKQNYNEAKVLFDKLIARQTQEIVFDTPREKYLDEIASNKVVAPVTNAAPTVLERQVPCCCCFDNITYTLTLHVWLLLPSVHLH